jgi:hypothetical protein
VDLAEFIGPPGVIEDAFRGRRLAGIDMCHDADISVSFERGRACHERNSDGAAPNRRFEKKS